MMVDSINEPEPLPSDLSSTSKIEAIPDIGDEHQEVGGKDQTFASLMQEKSPAQGQMPSPKVTAASPFDLAGIGAKPIAAPNMDTLTRQVNVAQNTLNTVHGQLSYPNLKLKASQKYLVKNKLMDANNHLRAANAKMGIAPEATPEAAATTKESGPIAQYLGYVTDGMNQLESAKKQLGTISAQGSNLSPAEFMLLQLKFNKAQQELDFTSAVLGKSIEGFKTIMNVQI
jgi:flagellar hook-basal body complex protein FliE